MVGVEEARHNVGMVYEPCSHFVAQPVEAEDHAEDHVWHWVGHKIGHGV